MTISLCDFPCLLVLEARHESKCESDSLCGGVVSLNYGYIIGKNVQLENGAYLFIESG